jgi:hypothetical protein
MHYICICILGAPSETKGEQAPQLLHINAVLNHWQINFILSIVTLLDKVSHHHFR